MFTHENTTGYMNIKIDKNCRLTSAIRWALKVNGIIDYNEETITVDENLSVIDINNEALQLGMELIIPCTSPARYVLKLMRSPRHEYSLGTH